MQPILSFNDLTEHLKQLHRTFRLAVVCGADASTAEAVMRAVRHEFAEAWFVGACEQVKQQTCVAQYTGTQIHFVETDSDLEAAERAVMMVRNGEADVLVKGLLHTDTLLRAVLNKEWGILPKGQVLTHIAMAQIPAYHKLLFLPMQLLFLIPHTNNACSKWHTWHACFMPLALNNPVWHLCTVLKR